MASRRQPFRVSLAKAILGRKNKAYIPALDSVSSVRFPGGSSGRINGYETKPEQLEALKGWVFAANSAIAEPCAAVELKLYRKLGDGTREEVTSGDDLEILELLGKPNMIHTGEQMRQLHFTYMNIVGESYTYMRDLKGEPFVPARGRLPAAMEIFPAHLVQFQLGGTYTQSVVRYGGQEYPITSIVRDLNPDPNNPIVGRSIVAASAEVIDIDDQMKRTNQNLMANQARPSLIFSTNETLDDEAYERWKTQFADEHTGVDNFAKPLLIENGTATPGMLSPRDLDYLESRKFSRDEILAMFKVSPGMIGSVENVNRSNLDAGFYINAIVNVVPRLRQYVRQQNASWVSIYDPTLEVDFVSPVPEDADAKLKVASELVDRVYTKDEVREMYGAKPLPDHMGEKIIVSGKAAQTLESVIKGLEESAGDATTATDESAAGKSNPEGKQRTKKP